MRACVVAVDVGETLNFEENSDILQQPSQAGTQESSSGKADADSSNKPTKSGRKSASTSPVPPATTTTSSSLASSPSLDVRAKFAANLFFLSGAELGHVITELECHCPEALEQLPRPDVIPPPALIQKNYWLEINVDVIPPKLFHSLQKYVTDKVGSMASPNSMSGGHHTNQSNNNKKQRQSTDSTLQHQTTSSASSKNLTKQLDDEFDDSKSSPTNAASATTLNRSNSSSKKRKK
jgi:hypothetical protein